LELTGRRPGVRGSAPAAGRPHR